MIVWYHFDVLNSFAHLAWIALYQVASQELDPFTAANWQLFPTVVHGKKILVTQDFDSTFKMKRKTKLLHLKMNLLLTENILFRSLNLKTFERMRCELLVYVSN